MGGVVKKILNAILVLIAANSLTACVVVPPYEIYEGASDCCRTLPWLSSLLQRADA